MPIEWNMPDTNPDWKAMPYEQRMRRIAWFTKIWLHYLNNQ